MSKGRKKNVSTFGITFAALDVLHSSFVSFSCSCDLSSRAGGPPNLSTISPQLDLYAAALEYTGNTSCFQSLRELSREIKSISPLKWPNKPAFEEKNYRYFIVAQKRHRCQVFLMEVKTWKKKLSSTKCCAEKIPDAEAFILGRTSGFVRLPRKEAPAFSGGVLPRPCYSVKVGPGPDCLPDRGGSGATVAAVHISLRLTKLG